MTLRHLRSNTAHKRPTAGGLSDGQLAVAYHADSPGVFFKDTAGAVVKIGPVHVGTTAPNVVPAGSSGNSKGEAWLDTSGTNPVLKIWNGTAWATVSAVASGTVVTTADTGTVTGTMIADGTITNTDINASAAIADSKLATIATADKVSLSALNIDGGTDIGAALVDADLIIVDDGGAGTNRKAAVTRISDYTFAKVSGDVTISSAGVAAIGAGVVVNADISASAAIAHSKLANLTSGQILLGNASNVPTGTAVTGDVTISNTGVTAIASGVVVDADINASAAIAHTKLASITAGRLLMGNASNVPTATAVTGDVTISNTGVTAIGASKVTNAMLAGSIADSKLSTISTAGKVSNSATTATNLNTASAIVARDASGNFAAGTITAALSGNASTATALSSNRTFALTGDITGTVASDLTSGASIATSIAAGVIVNADVNAAAAIADTKLATISTAGKVANSATTATSANTANAIVARDASGNIDVTSINSGPLAGFRNAIINGNFDVWQRGTSFSNPASGYLADRWLHGFDGSGSTRTTSRQDFTLGQTDVPGEPTYFFRYAQSVAGTGGTLSNFQQRIEGVRTFAGQQVTVSFYAKAAASTTLPSINLIQVFGTGGSPSASVTTTLVSSLAIGTGWARYTYTVTLPSISGKTLGSGEDDRLSLVFNLPLNSTFTLDFAQVQVEAGPVATPFERRPLGAELALCQRYYETGFAFFVGYQATGSSMGYRVPFAVTKRSVPTVAATNVSAGSNLNATPVIGGGDPVTTDSFSLYHAVTANTATFWRNTWTASSEL